MKSGIKILWLIFILTWAFYSFARVSETILYPEYRGLYDYRRITPELFPSDRLLRVISLGHDTTYADILWVWLIQSIADNVGNEKYLDFSHLVLKNITALSPYFTYPYQIDLLFTPLIYADEQEDMTSDERNKFIRSIEHGKEAMELLCDKDKIDAIAELPYGKSLWERQDLQNPCKDGMIPYYIGFHYANSLEEPLLASYYYKIASMQDDAPRSTAFLGPIAFANTTDNLDAALSFFLIAQDWYDKEPFQCHTLAQSLITDITRKRIVNKDWVMEIQKQEWMLVNPKDEKVIESLGSNNCYEFIQRWIKQIFIGYIADKSASHPDIVDARELVKQGIIDTIPTISTQSGYNMRKRDGKWNFRNY
jgi:hypothetical protein